MYQDDEVELKKTLIGARIEKIFYNEEYLKIQTDKGDFTFTASGDCCSRSLFYDFIGVKKLLGNVIVDFKEVKLTADDIETNNEGDYYLGFKDNKNSDQCIEVYGHQIIVEHPEWGEVTGVFSFRNYSNGYYGGSLEICSEREVAPEITDDVLLTVSNN